MAWLPLVRVRGAPLEPLVVGFPEPAAPLVWVRTGEVLAGAEPAGVPLAGLVRVRGALPGTVLGDPVARAPLVAVRAAGAPLVLCTAVECEPELWLLRGGLSWRTTWIVRLITWVRTSAAGCWAVAGVDGEPPRNA